MPLQDTQTNQQIIVHNENPLQENEQPCLSLLAMYRTENRIQLNFVL